MMNKKEITLALKKTIILVAIGTAVLFFSRSKNALTEDTSVADSKLTESRKTIWVKSDSLIKFLEVIMIKQPGVFEIEASDSQIIIRALDEKPFNSIFLDGEYISRFANEEAIDIKKLDNGYGFSLTTELKNNVSFARIPAEVMQSILINKP